MELKDETTVRLGDAAFRVRRLTVAEIRAAGVEWRGGKEALGEEYDRLIRSHVTLEDGSAFDPGALSFPQMQRLINEMVGIPDGEGISSFIGLLC